MVASIKTRVHLPCPNLTESRSSDGTLGSSIEPDIHSVAERPLDRFPIMDIDVVIDHDKMLACVIGEMASPQRRCNLLRVAAMAFADLDAQELGPFAAPDPGHIRHTRLFEVLPGHRRE